MSLTDKRMKKVLETLADASSPLPFSKPETEGVTDEEIAEAYRLGLVVLQEYPESKYALTYKGMDFIDAQIAASQSSQSEGEES